MSTHIVTLEALSALEVMHACGAGTHGCFPGCGAAVLAGWPQIHAELRSAGVVALLEVNSGDVHFQVRPTTTTTPEMKSPEK